MDYKFPCRWKELGDKDRIFSNPLFSVFLSLENLGTSDRSFDC